MCMCVSLRFEFLIVYKNLILSLSFSQAKDKQLMTPLFVAATFGNFTICKALIDAGASFFCKDESEQMALHRASMEGHLVSSSCCCSTGRR